MKGSLPVEVSALASNHEETDSKAWLHALTGSTNNVLIFSPDTDTYHIGLPLLGRNSERKVVVQLSNTYDKHEFLFLNQLIDCMYRDVSVAHLVIAGIDIPKVFQHIFIISGCDYISFFADCGKIRVMDSFYQYSDFITGDVKAPGILTDTSANGEGFLSFLRLVECFYFKNRKAAFPNPSPYNLYLECERTGIIKYNAWLRIIRHCLGENRV